MAQNRVWYRQLALQLGTFTRDQKGVGFFAGGALILILFYLVPLQVRKSCVTINSMGSLTCEKLWEDWRKSYEAYIGVLSEKEVERSTNVAAWNGKRAYDLYEPEWVCDSEKRVGPGDINIGDGPKFVCAPESLKEVDDCLIYSIGSNYNFQFEDGIRKHAPNCQFHTFDGTMNLTNRALPANLEEKRIHFHNWNLDTASGTNDKGWVKKTIQEIVSELGHTGKTIQVFKIDCEGCEYGVMPHVIDMVKNGRLAIDQVQIEMHGTDAAKIQTFFQTMRSAGYAIFHKERNHWGCNGYSCVEYAFLSIEKSREAFKQSHCLSSVVDVTSSTSTAYKKILPSNPLANFKSKKCQSHYEPSNFFPRLFQLDERRKTLRIPLVSESLYAKGKSHAMEPHHPANEIVVNDEFKFVYVEVRKSGSSSIRKILNEYFNSSFNGCPNSIPRNDSCLVIGGRCSTLCLTEDHVEQYYFFSFVRNPEDRFYSGYKQAFNQRFSKRGIQLGNQTHINEVLEKIIVSHYHSDQHLESQTMSLTSPWISNDGKLYRIPIDYLGRVESLEDDLKDLLKILQGRGKREIPTIQVGRSNPGGKVLEKTRTVATTEIQRKIRSAYSQDFACLGYT